MIGTDSDVTDRKQVEHTLRHRLDLEELVADISKRFINVPMAYLDDTITAALQAVGEFSGVDRSYIFRFSEDGSLMSNTHEWCADGIEPQIDNLKEIPTDKIPWWMGRLQRFEYIHLPRLSDLPPEADFTRKALEGQSIKSLICVPMVYVGRLVGFLGFDAVRQKVTWSGEDIVLLGMVAEIFVSALERKRVETEVQRMNQEKINQAKLMAGGFAHEMRNALFPARGSVDKLAEMLDRSALDAEACRKYLKITEVSLTRAMEITTLISQYTRLDSEYLPEKVVVAALVDEVLTGNELRIRKQNVDIDVSGSRAVCVESNRRQLYSVLDNLLINSLDALEEADNPSVGISWELADNTVHLIFSDNGCGIRATDLSRVFEVFYSTKPDRGTGIGLATVKKIIGMYGGSVAVSSRTDHGTVFTIRLKAYDGAHSE
jgi:signal transduction histidine kinase